MVVNVRAVRTADRPAVVGDALLVRVGFGRVAVFVLATTHLGGGGVDVLVAVVAVVAVAVVVAAVLAVLDAKAVAI